jgi:hypothetical protein
MKLAALFYAGSLHLFYGCKEKISNDPARLIEGQYQVSYYIVENDTLISPEKGNVSPYSHFSLKVMRKSENVVDIFIQTGVDGGGQGSGEILIEKEGAGQYKLVMADNTIDTNFGFADGKNITLNGAGWNPVNNQRIHTIIKGQKL